MNCKYVQVPNFPGNFISKTGEKIFKSWKRNSRFPYSWIYDPDHLEESIIWEAQGYRVVSLTHSSGVVKKKVAWIILETFVGPRPEGYVSCHKNGNSLEDTVENLYWGTQKQNGQDKIRHGRSHNIPRGENSKCSKLTSKEAKEIFSLSRIPGANISDLSLRYNISRRNILRIKNQEIWIKELL